MKLRSPMSPTSITSSELVEVGDSITIAQADAAVRPILAVRVEPEDVVARAARQHVHAVAAVQLVVAAAAIQGVVAGAAAS